MKRISNLLFSFLLLTVTGSLYVAQSAPEPLSEQMAATAINTFYKNPAKNESGTPAKWTYEYGVVLNGIEKLWLTTGDGKYFKYIQQGIDRFVKDDGTIATYDVEEFNIDNIKTGTTLLLLYRVTGLEKYKKAATLLRSQLKMHPRTNEGGFWHKKIYPYQMWLDGLYMGAPFYAEYAAMFDERQAFDDIANQFIWMEKHSRNDKTGLLYHGWDESKQQRWADKTTGRSPNVWGRAMGWYAMGLVDVLDHFPKEHPKRAEIVAILNRLAVAIKTYQEPKTGLWYLLLDRGGEKGNYLESSSACMFVYALAKGVRQGNLPASYLKTAQKAYKGIQEQFVKTDANGNVNLEGTISVAGLGNTPYRDGSYEYYLSEKVVTNDPKGVGAFLLASNEMEIAAKQSVGNGKTLLLDYYFNSEWKKDSTGKFVQWHYVWEEMTHGGFYLWGNIFRNYGVKTDSLTKAPTSENLKDASIYIIVDPDTEKETEKPNFIEASHIKAITDWVKSGGVLVLMGNDVGNAEFDHFNQLAKEFGVQFNKDSKNRVQGDDFAMGKITTDAQHPIFKTARTLYLKELATLSVAAPAKPILQDKGYVVMAVAKFGKGTVFALGDPWLYNEYVDGRKLPAEYENYKAADDLAKWLIGKSSASKK